MCQSLEDARLLARYFWLFSCVRFYAGPFESEPELADTLGTNFVDDAGSLQEVVVHAGFLFNVLHRGEVAKLALLTREQAELLRMFRENSLDTPRLLLGPPGSGKSVVFMELIRDTVCVEGKKVLYVCANVPLSLRVREAFRGVVGISVCVASEAAPTRDMLKSYDFVVFDELQSYPNRICWDYFEEAEGEVWACVDPTQAVDRGASGLPTLLNLCKVSVRLFSLLQSFEMAKLFSGRQRAGLNMC